MSPKNATTSRATGKRFYSWRNEKFWSVTTIIGGGIPKPALINWAKKYTAEYAVNNITKLNALLAADAEGQVDDQGAIDWLKNAAWRERDKGGDLGTRVHAAAEAYRLGKPMPPWDDDVAARMVGFIQWLEDFKPTFRAVEASVYSRQQHYAGTLDAIVDINGQSLVIDYKSAKTGIYPEVALQLSAYRYADFIGLPDGTEEPMPEVNGAAALWLRSDESPDTGRNYEFMPVVANEDVFRQFQYVREVFRWCEESSKRVLGGRFSPDFATASPEDAQRALDLSGVN